MVRQVQGRLTPCWVHLLGDQGCMHWQSGTFLLTSPPHTHTHPCWCMSVSLKYTVVSCMTCWTTGKGVCLCKCFVMLKELKNAWGTRSIFWILNYIMCFFITTFVLSTPVLMLIWISSPQSLFFFLPSLGYLPGKMDRRWSTLLGCVMCGWTQSAHCWRFAPFFKRLPHVHAVLLRAGVFRSFRTH